MKAIWRGLAVLVTGIAVFVATTATSSAETPAWTMNATAKTNGNTITVVSHFTAAKAGTYLFGTELYNSSEKLQKLWSTTQAASAGKTYTYTHSFAVAATGIYHVDLGVFTNGGNTNPAWKEHAAIVLVNTFSNGKLLVGMGGSWASGAGNAPYIDTPECYRSAKAFPALAAERLGYSSKNVACSGADTSDLISSYNGESAQTSKAAGASVVVLNVGGNDYDIWGAIESGSTSELASFNDNVSSVNAHVQKDIAAIKNANASAKIIVMGYADFIPTTDAVWNTCAPMAAGNNVASLHKAFTALNNNIRAAATAQGATFINPTSAMSGHGICAPTSNRYFFSLDQDWDLHPNSAGQSVLATLVVNALS